MASSTSRPGQVGLVVRWLAFTPPHRCSLPGHQPSSPRHCLTSCFSTLQHAQCLGPSSQAPFPCMCHSRPLPRPLPVGHSIHPMAPSLPLPLTLISPCPSDDPYLTSTLHPLTALLQPGEQQGRLCCSLPLHHLRPGEELHVALHTDGQRACAALPDEWHEDQVKRCTTALT